MVKEIDLGKDLETIVIGLRNVCGAGLLGDFERNLIGAHLQSKCGGV